MPRLKTPRLVTGTRIAVASELHLFCARVHLDAKKIACALMYKLRYSNPEFVVCIVSHS